jgi:O-antigen biosynthesis protein
LEAQAKKYFRITEIGCQLELSVIIVNYNVKEFLQNLLHSIEKASSNISKEIIVIDNASDDGSVEVIKEKFPAVILIENKINVGFGRANNQGLAIAKGDFILFINPDCIVSEDTIDKMLLFFKEHPECGLAGCKILNFDGTLQLACRRSFPGPWTSFTKVTGLSNLFPKSRIFARYNLTYLDENKTYEVDAVSGSFMMIRKEVYEKVGGFDEQFFMYGEDLDLCYRVQKSGFKVYYVHSTQVIHYKGESTKRSNLDETKLFYDAMHLFVKKHLSSFPIVELILRLAIGFRKFFAFLAKRRLEIFAAFTDLVFFNFCLFLAEKIYMGMTDWIGFLPPAYPIIYTVPAIIYVTVSYFTGSYKKESLSIFSSIVAIFISFLIITSLTFFFKQYAFSRAVVLIAFLFFVFSTVAFRIALKLIFRIGVSQNGSLSRRTVIIGTTDDAVELAHKLKKRKTDVHSVIGLVGQKNSDIGKTINEFKVIGSLQNISKVINEKKINEVIFSTKNISYREIMSVVSTNQANGVDYKIVGNEMDFVVGKTSISMLDDIPLVEVQYNILNPSIRIIKTLFDYMLGILVLFLVYPFIYLFSKLSHNKTEFQKLILDVPAVISGRMSFVGPKEVNDALRKYYGKPGLTGLWYVEDCEESEIEKLDFFYAKNQNIWLDLDILGKTLNKIWNKGD